MSEYDASTQSIKLTMSSGSLDDFNVSHNNHTVDAVELKIISVLVLHITNVAHVLQGMALFLPLPTNERI